MNTACALFKRLAVISLLGVLGACSSNTVQILQPSQVHEVCMVLSPLEQLEYTFNANAGVRFNIHYHVNEKIIYPQPEQLVAGKQGLFRPDVSQEYCLMWTNPSRQPVTLEFSYQRRTVPG